MQNYFELAAGTLIEVDPFRRSTWPSGRNANVSAIDFSAGRGSTGVDLWFYPHDNIIVLPKDQQDELRELLQTNPGKKTKYEFFKN